MEEDGAWDLNDDGGIFGADTGASSLGGDSRQPKQVAADMAQRNPLITTEQDTQMHSQPVSAPTGDLEQPGDAPWTDLVAVYDEHGNPQVARARMQNGKPVFLEEPRRPTPDEYNSLMFKGKIVRGGVVGTNVPTGTNLAPTMQKTPLGQTQVNFNWKRIGLVGVGALALGGAGFWLYKRYGKEA